MKRDTFEQYVLASLLAGKKASAIIAEIDLMLELYGKLVLLDADDKEVIIEPFWLNNFKYQDVIQRMEKLQQRN